MSLHLEFEPHSWYMGFAIKDDRTDTAGDVWAAYIADGNSYSIFNESAETLIELKYKIRQYHLRKRNGYGERIAARRLKVLRGYIQQEGISYGQIAELQRLAPYIEADDVELLEWAGVSETSAEFNEGIKLSDIKLKGEN